MSVRLESADWIWRDGEFIAWDDAKIHILSLAVQFGSSVFEGIRCYKTPKGPAVFRLPEHLRRLRDSCRVYRIELPYSAEDLTDACLTLVGEESSRGVLHQARGAAGVWGCGHESRGESDRDLHRLLAMGHVLGRRRAGAGGRCLRFDLATHGAQHIPGGSEGGGSLH